MKNKKIPIDWDACRPADMGAHKELNLAELFHKVEVERQPRFIGNDYIAKIEVRFGREVEVCTARSDTEVEAVAFALGQVASWLCGKDLHGMRRKGFPTSFF